MTDLAPLINAITAGAEPTLIRPDRHVAAFVVPAGGQIKTVDVEHLADRPRRKRGTVLIGDTASMASYLAKHATADTEVWTDLDHLTITAVINAHGEDAPGWGDHRAVHRCKTTPGWDAWTATDGKLLTQQQFAELIETRAVDVVKPAAAEMLEVAQHFSATVGVRYESSRLLSNGQRQFEYREQVEAKAGRAGRLDVPTEFELALEPLAGAGRFRVTARFRYRMADGGLQVGYQLVRPEVVLEDAFAEVVAGIAEAVGTDEIGGGLLLSGSPS